MSDQDEPCDTVDEAIASTIHRSSEFKDSDAKSLRGEKFYI